jgi:hypothetical protein
MRGNVRLIRVLVASGLMLTACTRSNAPSPVPPQGSTPKEAAAQTGGTTGSPPMRSAPLPSKDSVVNGRFTTSVALDDGRLTVDPAPVDAEPVFSRSTAAEEIWASPSLQGSYPGRVFGFGLVTISPSMGQLTPPPKTPAWIGFAWGGAYRFCSLIVSPSAVPPLASNGYKAVIVGAKDGYPALAYSARSSICDAPATGPRLASATHIVSIDWQSLGIQGSRLNIRYRLPGCGRLFSLQAAGTPNAETIEVDAEVPDVPMPCPFTGWVRTSMQLASGSNVLHAPTGTVRMIQP